jgi:hypothetical protein
MFESDGDGRQFLEQVDLLTPVQSPEELLLETVHLRQDPSHQISPGVGEGDEPHPVTSPRRSRVLRMPVTVGRVATIRVATTDGGIGSPAPSRTASAFKLVYDGTPKPASSRSSADNMETATRARFRKHSVASAEPSGNSTSKASWTRTRGPSGCSRVDIDPQSS